MRRLLSDDGRHTRCQRHVCFAGAVATLVYLRNLKCGHVAADTTLREDSCVFNTDSKALVRMVKEVWIDVPYLCVYRASYSLFAGSRVLRWRGCTRVISYLYRCTDRRMLPVIAVFQSSTWQGAALAALHK
jgi:hypothetical protein